jgi:sterol desaturase/sphingolipid hydroxylase (fatty acid hydroxylase superfamily)
MENQVPKLGMVLFVAAVPLYVLHIGIFQEEAWRAVSRVSGCDTEVGLATPITLPGGILLDRERLVFALVASVWLEAVFFSAQCLMAVAAGSSNGSSHQWSITQSRRLTEEKGAKTGTGGRHHAPSKELLERATSDAVLNHCLRPFLLWLTFPAYRWRGVTMFADIAGTASVSSSSTKEMFPSALTIACHVIVAAFVDDALFYWSHRFLHSWPWLYRTVHKQHHEFKEPSPIATEFAHPVCIGHQPVCRQ